jgi:hypothetical protein
LEEIADEDELYRRLLPMHINEDGTVNSAAFKRRGKLDTEISVDLARRTTMTETLDRAPHRGFGLGQLMAMSARQIGFDVWYDPQPDSGAHCLIVGENKKQRCRRLAEATVVCIVPPRRGSSGEK